MSSLQVTPEQKQSLIDCPTIPLRDGTSHPAIGNVQSQIHPRLSFNCCGGGGSLLWTAANCRRMCAQCVSVGYTFLECACWIIWTISDRYDTYRNYRRQKWFYLVLLLLWYYSRIVSSSDYLVFGPRAPRGVQRTGGRRRRLLLYSINSGFFCLQNSTGIHVGINTLLF